VDIETPDSILTALCALAAMMLFFTVMYPVVGVVLDVNRSIPVELFQQVFP
jgi:hypothetical protein